MGDETRDEALRRIVREFDQKMRDLGLQYEFTMTPAAAVEPDDDLPQPNPDRPEEE